MIGLIQRSTIHGVNHIYSTRNKIFKSLWVILFVVGLLGISVNIVFVVKKFISNPVMVNHDWNYEPFIWPELTFCNPTAPIIFKKNTSAVDLWMSGLEKSRTIAKAIVNETNLFRNIYNDREDTELAERTINMLMMDLGKLKFDKYDKHFNWIYFRLMTGGIHFTRHYENDNFFFNYEDLQKTFTTQTVQHFDNTPCHTFHLDKIRSLPLNRIDAISIGINLDYFSYDIFNSSYSSRNILLYISKKDELPSRKPIVLLPGFRNVVRLTQSRTHHNNVRRPCRHDKYQVELYDALLQSTRSFEGRLDDCKSILSQELYVEHCNCYSPFLPIYKNVSGFPRLCLNASLYSVEDIVRNAKCMENVLQRYKTRRDFRILFYNRCRKFRPIKCDDLVYGINAEREYLNEYWTGKFNVRKSNYFRKLYKRISNLNKSDDNFIADLRNNLIEVVLERADEYGDLYEEQRVYPFSELLSDIGGLMGLWLGMSIVGLFEIVQYFYLYLRMKWGRRANEDVMKEKKAEENEEVDASL